MNDVSNGPNIILNQQMLLDDLYVLRSKMDDTTNDGREAKMIVDRIIQLIVNAQTDARKGNLPRITTRRG